MDWLAVKKDKIQKNYCKGGSPNAWLFGSGRQLTMEQLHTWGGVVFSLEKVIISAFMQALRAKQ